VDSSEFSTQIESDLATSKDGKMIGSKIMKNTRESNADGQDKGVTSFGSPEGKKRTDISKVIAATNSDLATRNVFGTTELNNMKAWYEFKIGAQESKAASAWRAIGSEATFSNKSTAVIKSDSVADRETVSTIMV